MQHIIVKHFGEIPYNLIDPGICMPSNCSDSLKENKSYLISSIGVHNHEN